MDAVQAAKLMADLLIPAAGTLLAAWVSAWGERRRARRMGSMN